MVKRKKWILLALLMSLTVGLSGCDFFQQPTSAIFDYDYTNINLVQLEKPPAGQPMAIIDTSLGTIKTVLYPEYAPNTVDNFIARANEGFYDGKSIFSVEQGVYFVSGASDEKNSKGRTNDGNPIPNEYSVNLWPYKGAILSYYSQQGFGDSRFFIVNNYEFTEENAEEIRSVESRDGGQLIPDSLIQTFIDNEIVLGMAGFYTIFGQTISGFDVIDKITSVAADEKTFVPLEDIFIEKVTITEYQPTDSDA